MFKHEIEAIVDIFTAKSCLTKSYYNYNSQDTHPLNGILWETSGYQNV